MKPYSQDLRKRVLAKARAGKQTQVAIAKQFAVSLSTVEKWLRRKRETGKSTPRFQGHGPKRTLQHCAALIRAEIKRQPDLTLAELCEHIANATGIVASPSMMCRELQQLRLPRKKSHSTTVSEIPRAFDACVASLKSESARNGAYCLDT